MAQVAVVGGPAVGAEVAVDGAAGGEARDARPGELVDRLEGPDHQHPAVLVDVEPPHPSGRLPPLQAEELGSGSGIEAVVEGPVGVQPCDAGAGVPVVFVEVPADHDPAVGMEGHRLDAGQIARGPVSGMEALVHRSVRFEPGDLLPLEFVDLVEVTRDQDPPVRLGQDDRDPGALEGVVGAGDAVSQIESGVRGAVGKEPDQAAMRLAVVLGEYARGQDASVGPRFDVEHDGARSAEAGSRIEGGVEGAVGIEPGDPRPLAAADGAEVAARQDLPVGLDGHRHHGRVRDAAGHREGGIPDPVGPQHDDPVHEEGVLPAELPRRHDAAVGQQGHVSDPVPGIEIALEAPVDQRPPVLVVLDVQPGPGPLPDDRPRGGAGEGEEDGLAAFGQVVVQELHAEGGRALARSEVEDSRGGHEVDPAAGDVLLGEIGDRRPGVQAPAADHLDLAAPFVLESVELESPELDHRTLLLGKDLGNPEAGQEEQEGSPLGLVDHGKPEEAEAVRMLQPGHPSLPLDPLSRNAFRRAPDPRSRGDRPPFWLVRPAGPAENRPP